MNDPRGSIWRKWDLHVHTPATKLNNGFEGQTDSEKWERFIAKLEQTDLCAMAVTNYFCLDGYQKVLEYKSQGRLSNVDVIFPNVEFRINQPNRHGEYINIHVLFSDRLTIPELEDFLNRIPLINTTSGSTSQYCTQRDLGLVGYERALIDFSQIVKMLQNDYKKHDDYIILSPCRGHGNYRPSPPSAQEGRGAALAMEIDKESGIIYGNCDDSAFFLDTQRFVGAIPKSVILASDAHSLDDIGSKYTWIKADTTFEGLNQIINEPEDRVFIGDEPEILKRVKNNKTKYIHSFTIKKEKGSTLDEIWFDDNPEIVLNQGLISIIGNKGSGKSSVADTLGLLGNTQQSGHFSFLNTTKFRDKKDNKAKHFKATMKWESGNTTEINLNNDVDGNAIETIKFIPQNYLEKICTEQLEGSLFNDELKKVIFSHVGSAEKMNFNKLDDLIEYETKEKSKSIEIIKNEIATLNKEIAILETKLHPDYKIIIDGQLRIKQQEKASHEQAKPNDKTEPIIDPVKQQEIEAITTNIYSKVQEIKTLEQEIDRLEKEKKNDYSKFINSKKLLDKLDNFQKQYDIFKGECKVIAETMSLNIDDIVKLEISKDDIAKINTQSWADYSTKSDMLKEDKKDGPFMRKQQLQKEIDALRDQLDQPNKEYQAFLRDKAEWEAKLKMIEGDETTADTIKYYQKQIDNLLHIPADLLVKRQERLTKVFEIHGHLSKLRDEYGALYKPVKDYIDVHESTKKDRYSMDFRVAILCEGFIDKFFEFIAHNKKGSFYESDKGRKRLKDIIDSSEFDNTQGIESFLQKIEEDLNIDQRYEPKETRYIVDQLKDKDKIQAFYDYIYNLDYLKPQYILRWAGKDLSQLSPGERGTVLLIFYLFISKDDIPLIIDQPEENLDNETVYGVLVPCIKEAKKRRQIIIVTHNPNLAVVCDADQIIHCEMKKEQKNKITYLPGAIENPKINKALIDILEGTRPAFDNRDHKYYVGN